ncbi:MAG: type II toxin-antitoxin system ParD family antitoxin [Sphingomonadales bacterium]
MNAKNKAYVQKKVRSGEYESEDAVYQAGIEALRQLEAWEDELREEIERGYAQARAGRFSSRTATEIGEAVKREMLGE